MRLGTGAQGRCYNNILIWFNSLQFTRDSSSLNDHCSPSNQKYQTSLRSSTDGKRKGGIHLCWFCQLRDIPRFPPTRFRRKGLIEKEHSILPLCERISILWKIQPDLIHRKQRSQSLNKDVRDYLTPLATYFRLDILENMSHAPSRQAYFIRLPSCIQIIAL